MKGEQNPLHTRNSKNKNLSAHIHKERKRNREVDNNLRPLRNKISTCFFQCIITRYIKTTFIITTQKDSFCFANISNKKRLFGNFFLHSFYYRGEKNLYITYFVL